jgi:hypothetical protein
VALLVVVALAVAGVVAPEVYATPEYVHGGIPPAACEVCHTDNHTNWPVASEKCLTCHGYDAPDLPVTCWTCHTPGQDMSAFRTDAACTAGCHLTDGSTSRHAAHAGGGTACTTCHPVSPSVSDAGREPHHVAALPPAPSVSGFSPSGGAPGTTVTVTGDGFTKVIAVTFGGVRASTFTVLSESQLSARVPAGATSGPVAVTNTGGTGTSTTSFVVPGQAPASVSLVMAPAATALGGRVTVSGTVRPATLGRTDVTVTVQRRSGDSWATSAVRVVRSTPSGSYRWTWRPPKSGVYRARATIAATAEHPAMRSAWAGLRVR